MQSLVPRKIMATCDTCLFREVKMQKEEIHSFYCTLCYNNARWQRGLRACRNCDHFIEQGNICSLRPKRIEVESDEYYCGCWEIQFFLRSDTEPPVNPKQREDYLFYFSRADPKQFKEIKEKVDKQFKNKKSKFKRRKKNEIT